MSRQITFASNKENQRYILDNMIMIFQILTRILIFKIKSNGSYRNTLLNKIFL
ncbi:unnamed protein product [Paramecium sonneborni]|uniref:Uncharacterized protein n=1 Tax=Paramecium sonneborni TaxID=65129 RepID=A0A8S1Q5F0_9CILI|nr:unnamed protein product [Paramecium sonneborni]